MVGGGGQAGREGGGEPVPWIHTVDTLLSGSDVK